LSSALVVQCCAAINTDESILNATKHNTTKHNKHNIGRKSQFVHTPPLHSAHPLTGSSLEYRHKVLCEKTRMVRLPDGEKILRIRLGYRYSFWRTFTNVTDGRTDRHRVTVKQSSLMWLCIARCRFLFVTITLFTLPTRNVVGVVP